MSLENYSDEELKQLAGFQQSPLVQMSPAGQKSTRYNNPYNIEYRDWQVPFGATLGEDRRFGQYPNPEAGVAAATQLIQNYANQGLTLGQAINKFAPTFKRPDGSWENPNTPQRIQETARILGVSPDTPLADIPLGPFMQAHVKYESPTQINPAIWGEAANMPIGKTAAHPRFEQAGKIASEPPTLSNEELMKIAGISPEGGAAALSNDELMKIAGAGPESRGWGEIAKGAAQSIAKPTAQWLMGAAQPIVNLLDKLESPEDTAIRQKAREADKARILGELTYTPQTTTEKAINFLPQVVGSLLPYIGSRYTLGLGGGLGGIPGTMATFAGAELPQAYQAKGMEGVKEQLPWTLAGGLGFGGIQKYIPGFWRQGAAVTGLMGGESALRQQLETGQIDPWQVAEAAGTMALLHGTGYPEYRRGMRAEVPPDIFGKPEPAEPVPNPFAAGQRLLPAPRGEGGVFYGPEMDFTMGPTAEAIRRIPGWEKLVSTPEPPAEYPPTLEKVPGKPNQMRLGPEYIRRMAEALGTELPDTAGLRTSPPITENVRAFLKGESGTLDPKVFKEILAGKKLPDLETLQQQGRDYVAQGMSHAEAVDQLGKDYGGRTRAQMLDILEGRTPAGKVPLVTGEEKEAPKRIVKQRFLTLEKPAFDEIFTSRKEARGFPEYDPENYMIKKNRNGNFQIHERVGRIPLYEDTANIAANLAAGKDLERGILGAKADTFSLEPSIGTFQRLERRAPGITENLWYRAKELENQAYQRFQDFKDQLAPYLKGLSFGSSKRIAAWATAQQESGPETLQAMGVKLHPLSNKELDLYDFGRQVYQETLPKINEARVLAGQQPIPERENYAPFIRQYAELLRSGGDPITVTADYFHPLATPFKYAKERKWNVTPLRLDFVKDLKNYMEAAYKHIELSPFVSTVREMVNKITMPDGKEISLREESPYTAQYLTKWADRIAGKQETFMGPVIDKTLMGLANNIGVATLSGLGTSAIKQPTSLPLGWAGIAHIVGYVKATLYMNLALKDSLRPSFWKQAMAESNVLPTREMDVTWKESIAEAHSLVGDLLGKLSPKLGAASDIITGIKKGIAGLGYRPLSFLDMHAAMVTWGAAKRAGLGMGMAPKDAVRFADTIVTRTQASGSAIDRGPIQSNPLGKFMSVFQTFVMNDFDFIKKEIVGLHGPKDLSAGEFVKRALMFAGAGALVNIFYRDVLGGNAPMPEPIAASYRKYKETGDIGRAALEVPLEMTSNIPLLGGLRYGSGILGAGPQFLADVSAAIGGKPMAPSPLKVGGKLLGVPFTEQISRLARASQGKMTLGEAFLGKTYHEKPKKSKGFGGFGRF